MTAAALARPREPASDTAEGHEFTFDERDFQQIRKLIFSRAGIALQPGKHAMVYSRVSRRLRACGQRSFASYLEWLESARGDAAEREWQEFVNCLTTNLTSFFREAHHFEELQQMVRENPQGMQKVWCNAASTGEEPYTIAMTMTEALAGRGQASILATDIDTQVLATAARAVYPADARGLDAQRLKQHFLRGVGRNAGSIRVKPELTGMVTFRTHNLIEPHWKFATAFDVVFCRNVMIYFDHKTQREVLARIHATMRPGGMLFVGHSENFTDVKNLFRLRGKTIYERL